MAKSTLKKSLMALLAFMLAISPFIFSSPFASAVKEVSVGSSLFTAIDNVTVVGTKDGLKLYSSGKRDTSAQYARTLYLKDFELKYKVTSDDFSAIYFEILGENGSTEMGNISDEDRTYRLTLSKKNNAVGVNVKGKDVDFDAPDVAVNFTDDITLKLVGDDYNSLKFKINGTVIDEEISVFKFEGMLTVGFEGIDIGETAEIYIKEINGQKFTYTKDGYAEDDKAPVLRINTAKLTGEAPQNKLYELPVYGLDVISSTIKYNIKWTYSADADFEETEELTFTDNAITFEKEGYYMVKDIKINDNNGNETNDCIDYNGDIYDYDESGTPIIIHARPWDDSAPEILTFTDSAKKDAYLGLIMAAGYKGGRTHRFQFEAPEVVVTSTPAGVTENPELVKYKLRYRLVSSTSWSEIDGLVFTASSANVNYVFQIKAIDRQGNSTRYEDSPEITVMFEDVTPPKFNVTWFTTERYLNQAVSLPSGSASDDLDSSPTTTVRVYYILDENGDPVYEKDEDGNILYEDEENTIPKKVLVSDTTSFTPDKTGWYEVIFTAEDKAGNVTESSPLTFKVVKAAEAKRDPIIDLSNTWNIVFLSIAGACALGLIIIPFIKPKEE